MKNICDFSKNELINLIINNIDRLSAGELRDMYYGYFDTVCCCAVCGDDTHSSCAHVSCWYVCDECEDNLKEYK